ncbi:MAG TPA: hypothetical protein VMJ64_11875 [Anaerolineales bacterium]|nr:hypothetical protein [Anaerolineales bacterium]
MSKQLSPKDAKRPSSGKIDTTIVVALFALIGTLATALFNSPVILEWLRNKPTATALSAPLQSPSDSSKVTAGSSTAQGQLSSNSSNPLPVAPAPLPSGGSVDCLAKYFADIEPTRQISIEEGASGQDYPILSQDLAKTDFLGPIGIRLTKNGKMIAGISFIFFIDSHLFKLTSVVDSKCQGVAQYSNADRGGDRNMLQDSDTLKIELAEGLFSLRLTFWGPADFRFTFLQL